jgi:hypothetical protein
MRAEEVVVEKEVREEGGAVVTGLIGASVGPFAGDGLDEAFGFAVGLRAIGPSEEMFDVVVATGGGKVMGTIGGAAIGEDTLDLDAVVSVESDGLVESLEDAGQLLVGEQAGKGDSGMIINSDVEMFDASVTSADGAITGGANAGTREASQLLDIEMEELAGAGSLIPDGWGRRRIEGGEALEAVALENAGDGGLGDTDDGEDLGVGAALAS